jgi:hypothetical protein
MTKENVKKLMGEAIAKKDNPTIKHLENHWKLTYNEAYPSEKPKASEETKETKKKTSKKSA